MSTFDKVKDVIIDKLGVEEESIKSEAHFVDDLGADSLDTVNLLWKKSLVLKFQMMMLRKSLL